MLLMADHAGAHGGFENETEVRVDQERMRVVVRTSLSFAWTLLGDHAPRAADEVARAIARPILAAEAPGLFKVDAGGKSLTPLKADCLFENLEPGHEHVAFTLDFAPPAEWPVTFEATFFPRLGELDTGSVAVFDQSQSRFNRDIEPLLRKTIHRGDPTVTFDLRPAAPGVTPAKAQPPGPQPAAALSDQRPEPLHLVAIFLLAGIAGWLARGLWRRSRKAS